MLARLRAQQALWIILIVRLAVSLTFSFLTPPWEADNEEGHFAYARYLARYRQLLQPGDPEAEAVWERFQPPLYYLLAALPLTVYDLGPTFIYPETNPYLGNGNAGVNHALHPQPITSTLWALYTTRIVSVLLSTASVVAMYALAWQVWPRSRRAALTATLLYAFWPQWLFIGAMVTNDSLVTALATVSVYLSVRLAQVGFRLRRALPLGVLLALALLTKLNGLALLPLVLAAMSLSLLPSEQVFPMWRTARFWGALSLMALAFSVAFMLVTSLQFVTEQVLHFQTFIDLAHYLQTGQAAQPEGFQFILASLRYSLATFFASYGWGNVEIYSWLYPLWAGLAALALLGVGWAWWCRPNRVLSLLMLYTLSLMAMMLALAVTQRNIHVTTGRYLLPALAPVCVLLVTGWQALTTPGIRRWLWPGLSVGLVLISWSIPWGSIAPAYAPPPPFTGTVENPLHLRFGEAIELLGYATPAPVAPNGEATLTACWQTHAPLTENYSVLVEVVGADGQGYGRYQTYPGLGNYPTRAWAVNMPFCDTYRVHVGAAIPAPSVAYFQITLLTTPDTNGPRLVDEQGRAIVARLPVKISAPTPSALPRLPQAVNVRFGDALRLTNYALHTEPRLWRTLHLTLQWEALRDLDENYTVFVHLRDTPTTAAAQADGPPTAGRFPTAFWDAGDLVLDERVFTLAPQAPTQFDVYLGVLTANGQRLPAFTEMGVEIPNGEVRLIAGLQIERPANLYLLYLPTVLQSAVSAPPSAPYP